jgi:hypothetical protein
LKTFFKEAFIDERLVDQKSKLTIDFPKIAATKKGEIDVEEYKLMFAKNKKKAAKKNKS